MKISNSKKELARIISENGGWREGAAWSAQDSNRSIYGARVCFYHNKPYVNGNEWIDGDNGLACSLDDCIEGLMAIKNWHQTILALAEYEHLYPAPDADGWIEWEGGDQPVKDGVKVDVKYRTSGTNIGVRAGFTGRLNEGSMAGYSAATWSHTGSRSDIIAYRLHKPEQSKPEFCESVMRSIPEPEAKPTIERLSADYRSAKDCADRKQQEADDAKADADAKLKALELAGEAIGLLVSPITAKQETELVITDWRDLQVGDVIRCIGDWQGEETHGVELSVDDVESPDYGGDLPIRVILGGYVAWGKDFNFIRRP